MLGARKVIQIAAVGVDNNIATQCNAIIYGLCNDGSVWELRAVAGSAWIELPAVPQKQDVGVSYPKLS